jgi:hypothetical protein
MTAAFVGHDFVAGAVVLIRHFPAPWRADKMSGGYVVGDAKGKRWGS